MTDNQRKIADLLTPLVQDEDYILAPATKKQLEIFRKRALKKKVEQTVVDQLIELYQIANDYYYEIILAFYSCEDEIIFEWWDDQQLWLGQRDSYTLRWANGKFCLGDASNVSFSEEYEFDTLVELIERCVKDIREADYFGNDSNAE